jgi:hypothetical protein
MGRYCLACFHPNRAAIDAALVEHATGYARLAARFGLSYGGIRRHERAHLAHAFRDAEELHAMIDTEALVAKLEELDSAVRRVLHRGESGGDDRLVLLAVKEGRSNVDTLARLGALADVEARLVALEQARDGEDGADGSAHRAGD